MRRHIRAPLTILCVILSAEFAVCQQPAKTACQANLSSSNASTVAAESMPKPSWTVKYLAGSLHLDKDSWRRMAFGPQSVALGRKNLFIPVHADRFGHAAKLSEDERNF